MFKIGVLFFLLISLLSLNHHVIHSAINTHAVQTTSISKNSVKSIQLLRTSLLNLTDSIKTNNSVNYQILIKQLTNTRNYLELLNIQQSKYNLKIQKDIQSCPGVTTFNRKTITQPIIKIEQAEKNLIKFQSSCLTCDFFKNNLTNIKKQTRQYIEFVNKTLDGLFCQKRAQGQTSIGLVNIQNSLYKSNLKAKNWYYGSTTASDYKLYIFKRTTLFNLTECPLQTPFAKENVRQCFNCNQESVFNLGTQQCQTCKFDEILNIKKGTCQKCEGQKKFIQSQLVCFPCMLSQGKLFNNSNGKCYSCSLKQFLDVTSKKCIEINCPPENPKFNRQTLKCQPCQPGLFANPTNPSVCVKTNYIGLCSPNTPLYDFKQKICKPCPQGTKFMSATNTCQKIVSSSHLKLTHIQNINTLNYQTNNQTSPSEVNNKTLKNQTKPSQISNDTKSLQNNNTNNNITKPNNESNLTQNKTKTQFNRTKALIPSKQLIKNCSKGFIYIQKYKNCTHLSQTCNEHQFFDQQEQTCISISATCEQDEFYDRSKRKCVTLKQSCKQKFKYNPDKRQCQKQPFCKNDQIFNYQQKICQKKRSRCKSNQIFDKNQQLCLQKKYITSPYIKNIIYVEQSKQLILKYTNAKKNDISLFDCQKETPFYQKRSNTCIICPNSEPYFDLNGDKCVKCGSGTQYNSGKHQCYKLSTIFQNIPDTISRINI